MAELSEEEQKKRKYWIDKASNRHKLCWNELVDAIGALDFEKFGRGGDAQIFYYKERDRILREFSTMETYIRRQVFGEDVKKDPSSGKLVLSFPHNVTDDGFDAPEVDISDEEVNYRFVPNDYPYCVADHIDHDVLWSNLPLREKSVQSFLDEKWEGSRKFVLYTNPPAFRTIPGIFHIHVFSCMK